MVGAGRVAVDVTKLQEHHREQEQAPQSRFTGVLYAQGVPVEVLLLLVFGPVTLAATLFVLWAEWQGFRWAWSKVPPERRRLAIITSSLWAVALVGGSAVAVAEPWGQESVLYVMAAIGAAGFLYIALWAIAMMLRRRRTKVGDGNGSPTTRTQR